jgi:hypothetical protein
MLSGVRIPLNGFLLFNICPACFVVILVINLRNRNQTNITILSKEGNWSVTTKNCSESFRFFR